MRSARCTFYFYQESFLKLNANQTIGFNLFDPVDSNPSPLCMYSNIVPEQEICTADRICATVIIVSIIDDKSCRPVALSKTKYYQFVDINPVAIMYYSLPVLIAAVVFIQHSRGWVNSKPPYSFYGPLRAIFDSIRSKI